MLNSEYSSLVAMSNKQLKISSVDFRKKLLMVVMETDMK